MMNETPMLAGKLAIFRINYKSDFILTLESDAGWETPFCIKFWTGAPSQAYYAGWDGTTYTNCAPVEGDPSKLQVQFDNHHLPIGELKYQVGYHFTVADFPTTVEDEVINQGTVVIVNNGRDEKVLLDFNGETAPDIQFALPAYVNEAQRIANEQQRIANEQTRIANEQQRIQNEEQRIAQETARVEEFASLKRETESAAQSANDAATLANAEAQLAAEKAALAQAAATLANDKAALAQQKAEYAQTQGDYAKAQGDTAAADHQTAVADHQTAAADHQTAVADHTQAGNDHTRAESDHTRAESDHAAVELFVDSLGAFDISAYHATGGVLAKYANLTAALDSNNGGGVPQSLQKGGMSVKFVCSSDNKYVQYRLMSDTFSTTEIDWQGVDDEPTDDENLVKSNGIIKYIKNSLSPLVNEVGFNGYEKTYTGENDGIGMVWDGTTIVNTSSFKTIIITIPNGCKITWNIAQGTLMNTKLFNSYPMIGSTDINTTTIYSGWKNNSGNILYAIFQFRTGESYDPFNITVSLSDCGLMRNMLNTFSASYYSVTKLIAIEELGNTALDGIKVTIPNGPLYYSSDKNYIQLNESVELTCTGAYVYILFFKEGNYSLIKNGDILNYSHISVIAVISPKSEYPVSGLSVYKYNNIVYCPYSPSMLNGITSNLTQLSNEVNNVNKKLNSIDVIASPIDGVGFTSSTPDNIKNSIKKIWIVVSNSDDYDKIIEHCTSLYISVINNVPGAYAPYVSLSTTTESDDQAFNWYLTSQTNPRTGVETISLLINSTPATSWGLSGRTAKVYITIDWDIFGRNARYDNINVPIIVSSLNTIEPSIDTPILLSDLNQQFENSAIYGKTIVCFGDSLTEMIDTTSGKHYSDYIAEITGANMVNVGIGGSKICRRNIFFELFDEEKSYSVGDKCIYSDANTTRIYQFINAHTGTWDYNDVQLFAYQQLAYSNLDVISLIQASCEQNFEDVIAACEVIKQTQSDDNTDVINRLVAVDWSKVDAITIFAGTNDWYNANTLGTTGSTDPRKTLGAINEIVRMFLTAYPNIKIYWFTPIVRWVSGFNVNTNPPTIDDTKFSDNYNVEGNGTLKEECAAIIQEVAKNHIPICDMYNNFGWNKYNCKEYFSGTDGTHPRTQKGVVYLANKILNFLYANKTF